MNRNAFRSKYSTALLAFGKYAVNSIHVIDPCTVDGRPKLDELLIPGLYLGAEHVRALTVTSQTQQFILLLDHMIVLGNRAQISWLDSDDAAIQKPPPVTRLASDDFHLLGRENENVQVAKIALQRLSFSVDVEMLRGLPGLYLELLRDPAAQQTSPYYCTLIPESYQISCLFSSERLSVAKQVDGLKPVRLSLGIVPVEDVQAGPELDRAFKISESNRFYPFQ